MDILIVHIACCSLTVALAAIYAVSLVREDRKHRRQAEGLVPLEEKISILKFDGSGETMDEAVRNAPAIKPC